MNDFITVCYAIFLTIIPYAVMGTLGAIYFIERSENNGKQI